MGAPKGRGWRRRAQGANGALTTLSASGVAFGATIFWGPQPNRGRSRCTGGSREENFVARGRNGNGLKAQPGPRGPLGGWGNARVEVERRKAMGGRGEL